MQAVIATDGQITRLQQNLLPQRKTRFEPAVYTEVDFQQPGLRAYLRICLHFQLHQHGAYAFQQGINVDFPISGRVLKACGLSGGAGEYGCSIVVNDADHRNASIACESLVSIS